MGGEAVVKLCMLVSLPPPPLSLSPFLFLSFPPSPLLPSLPCSLSPSSSNLPSLFFSHFPPPSLSLPVLRFSCRAGPREVRELNAFWCIFKLKSAHSVNSKSRQHFCFHFYIFLHLNIFHRNSYDATMGYSCYLVTIAF